MVSYILPVFNAESTIHGALFSLLNQTYANLEVIIVDDGCSDTSIDIISKIKDSRIKIIKNEYNKGLVYSLNMGLKHAGGDFIARMDADDLCLPKRTEVQLRYLNENPVDLVGSYIKHFGLLNGTAKYPIGDGEIKAEMLFTNPIVHPSVLFRRKLLEDGIFKYDEDWKHVEDYALWIKLMDSCRFANVPQYLLSYRLTNSSICGANYEEQQNKSDLLRRTLISKTLPGITLTSSQIQWMKNPIIKSSFSIGEINHFIDMLIEANQENGYYEMNSFKSVLFNRFLSSCLVANNKKQNALKMINALSNKHAISFHYLPKAKLFIKGLLN